MYIHSYDVLLFMIGCVEDSGQGQEGTSKVQSIQGRGRISIYIYMYICIHVCVCIYIEERERAEV